MSDLSKSKIDWLNTLHARREATQKVLDSTNLFTAGGPEVVQVIAKDNPELLIQAITMLRGVIERQEETFMQMAEEKLQMLDELEKISETLKKKK